MNTDKIDKAKKIDTITYSKQLLFSCEEIINRFSKKHEIYYEGNREKSFSHLIPGIKDDLCKFVTSNNCIDMKTGQVKRSRVNMSLINNHLKDKFKESGLTVNERRFGKKAKNPHEMIASHGKKWSVKRKALAYVVSAGLLLAGAHFFNPVTAIINAFNKDGASLRDNLGASSLVGVIRNNLGAFQERDLNVVLSQPGRFSYEEKQDLRNMNDPIINATIDAAVDKAVAEASKVNEKGDKIPGNPLPFIVNEALLPHNQEALFATKDPALLNHLLKYEYRTPSIVASIISDETFDLSDPNNLALAQTSQRGLVFSEEDQTKLLNCAYAAGYTGDVDIARSLTDMVMTNQGLTLRAFNSTIKNIEFMSPSDNALVSAFNHVHENEINTMNKNERKVLLDTLLLMSAATPQLDPLMVPISAALDITRTEIANDLINSGNLIDQGARNNTMTNGGMR